MRKNMLLFSISTTGQTRDHLWEESAHCVVLFRSLSPSSSSSAVCHRRHAVLRSSSFCITKGQDHRSFLRQTWFAWRSADIVDSMNTNIVLFRTSSMWPVSRCFATITLMWISEIWVSSFTLCPDPAGVLGSRKPSKKMSFSINVLD